jgi:hypothetical protein
MEMEESKSSYGSEKESKPEVEHKSSFVIESSKHHVKKSGGISIKKSDISSSLVELFSDVFVLIGAIALAAYVFSKTGNTSIPILVWIALFFAIGLGFKIYAKNKNA